MWIFKLPRALYRRTFVRRDAYIDFIARGKVNYDGKDVYSLKIVQRLILSWSNLNDVYIRFYNLINLFHLYIIRLPRNFPSIAIQNSTGKFNNI